MRFTYRLPIWLCLAGIFSAAALDLACPRVVEPARAFTEHVLARGRLLPAVSVTAATCYLTIGGPGDGYIVSPIAPRKPGTVSVPSPTCEFLYSLAGKTGRLVLVEEP